MKKKPFIPTKLLFTLGYQCLYGPASETSRTKINNCEIQQIGPRKIKIRDVEIDLDEYTIDIQPYVIDNNYPSSNINSITGINFDSTIQFSRYTKSWKSKFLVQNPFGNSNSKRKLHSEDVSVKDLNTNKIHTITLRDFFQNYICNMDKMQFEAEVKEVYYNSSLVIRPIDV